MNKAEAYKMGIEAWQRGLPSSPLMNIEFWEIANKIDSHEPWKEVMNAYSRGWHSGNSIFRGGKNEY